jgi:hypothetical protein
LIVLDTLLNQQDRFGNLHYRPHYVLIGSGGELDWVRAKKKKSAELSADERKRRKAGEFIAEPKQASELSAKGYRLIKRMLLADNDCGVAKENRMAKANSGKGIASRIRHLHRDTYAGVQRLQRLAEKGVLAPYLSSELLMTKADAQSVLDNLKSLATTFKANCLAGKLLLDADPAQAYRKAPPVALGTAEQRKAACAGV